MKKRSLAVLGVASVLLLAATFAVALVIQRSTTSDEGTSALLRDPRFSLAFIRGRFPNGSAVVVTTRDGRPQQTMIRRRKLEDFQWWGQGTAAVVAIGIRWFGLSRDGRLKPWDATDPCPTSPEAVRNGFVVECGEFSVGTGNLILESGEENLYRDEPTVTADGTRLAVIEELAVDPPNSYIATYDVRTHRQMWGTDAPSEYLPKNNPTWSPDGTRLAYWVERQSTEFAQVPPPHWFRTISEAVIVVNNDGKVLTRIRNAARPAWSPDGNRIAFDRRLNGHRQIYVADADGTNVRQLTHGRLDAWRPRWRSWRGDGGAALVLWRLPIWLLVGGFFGGLIIWMIREVFKARPSTTLGTQKTTTGRRVASPAP